MKTNRLIIAIISILLFCPHFAFSGIFSKKKKNPEKPGISASERKKRQERFAKMHPKVSEKKSQFDVNREKAIERRAKKEKKKKK